MNYAIQHLVPMEANQTLNEYNKLNATKVRVSSNFLWKIFCPCIIGSLFANVCMNRFDAFMMLPMFSAVSTWSIKTW